MPEDLLAYTEAVKRVLASRPCGLVLDLDGTLAPIAPRPAAARVSPRCQERLAALAGLLDLAGVVSGRPALEAQRMVGLKGLVYLGCHGLERLRGEEVSLDPAALAQRERVREAAGQLAGRLRQQPGLEGLLVEDKGVCVTFHYRACRRPALARRLILHELEALDLAGVKVMEARRAVELLPTLEADKGTALTTLAQEFGLKGLFYLGDDNTDIAAFTALRAWREDSGGRGLAVAVSSPGSPREVLQQSDFVLAGVPGAEEFLGLLGQLLRPP